MAHLGMRQIGATLTFYVQSLKADGTVYDAASVPSYDVYEEETGTAIVSAGSMALLNDAGTIGFYSEQITLDPATGYEVGKDYCIRITATVDSIATAMLHTFSVAATSNMGGFHGGIAEGGAASTITLDASGVGASTTDDYYNGYSISIVGGTGQGQARLITDYVGSTRVATVDTAWKTNPAAGSVYSITPSAYTAAAGVWGATTRTVSAATNITSTGGTVPITAGALVSADVTAISTDTTAADNLEAIHETTPAGAPAKFTTLTVNKLAIVGADATAAVEITNSTAGGAAIKATGNTTGAGLHLVGGSGGPGLKAVGQGAFAGIETTGGSGGSGIRAVGTGAGGSGIDAEGGAGVNSYGIVAHGVSSGAEGFYAYTAATSTAGAKFLGSGQAGIRVIGGADSPGLSAEGIGTGAGIKSIGGATAGAPGIHAIGGSAGGAGIKSEGTSNNSGFYAQGHGTNTGLLAIGGATGTGATFQGGATSGEGFKVRAPASDSVGLDISSFGGAGVVITAAGDGDGISANGSGSGSGLQANGGASGHGIYAQSGGTDGAGIVAVAASVDRSGIESVGIGAGHGIHILGGATGHGLLAGGGATSGDGIRATATTDGIGIHAIGIGNKAGLKAIGGNGGAAGHGMHVVSGTAGTNVAGLRVQAATATATGHGVYASGSGTTGGQGFRCESGTSGQGFYCLGDGALPGFQATGGATGAGIKATAGTGADIDGSLGGLETDTYAELAAVPAATSSLKDKIVWLFMLARNKLTQTSTTSTLRNDADGADVATSAVSDNGTTYTRSEWT